MEEVARRMRDFDEGREEGIPAEEVMAKARALLEEPGPEPPKVRVGQREVTTGQVIDACLALPPDDRVALATQMLATLAESGEAEIDPTWLRDSERWLARARRALEASGAGGGQPDARREDEEALADVRAARREIEEEGTIPWEKVKRELE